MPQIRLIYFSENLVEQTSRSILGQLNDLLMSSQRNNERVGITGALLVESRWFLQILEGERAAVWSTFRRIEEDERHADVTIVEAVEISERLFGNWWMGLAARNPATAKVFDGFTRGGLFQPHAMRSKDILDLFLQLSEVGLSRRMAAAA